ncbi:hypothetical protein ACJ73_01792 [Blastomyces percursus]|uniref:Uncharacterized protein n=1 Tax=Blastomyces percursus TaxID=1658174 RepID=A0A1J9QE74_9EURO|nr:hypothetical protein ACJ73_01792 [Blastomyces percursus]
MFCTVNSQLRPSYVAASRATAARVRGEQELRKLSYSRGFTIEYQQDRETRENDQCRKAIAPATKATYDPVVELWWRLSRNEPEDTNFAKHELGPSAQTLKNFTEFYVTSRKKDLPSRQTIRQRFSCLVAEWEAKTCRVLPTTLKNDVYNVCQMSWYTLMLYLLTRKYGLSGKPREKFTATRMDINYLLRHLFGDDYHDYVHEIVRVYLGLILSLFSGSGARSSAVVESNAYRGSNESLYYKSKPGEVKYWVTIDQEFLKGQRYNDEKHV